MPNLILNTAQMLCPLPVCRKCNVKAAMESCSTGAASYTAGIRIVCQNCGRASEWHWFDNYCCSIPVVSGVIAEAVAEFNGKD